MTVSDDQSTPEARAAIAQANLVTPSWLADPTTCPHGAVEEVGQGFENDTLVIVVSRCMVCGTEFVKEMT